MFLFVVVFYVLPAIVNKDDYYNSPIIIP